MTRVEFLSDMFFAWSLERVLPNMKFLSISEARTVFKTFNIIHNH